MQERDFVEQLAELATRVNRIERWQEQWRTRNRKVAGLQADTVRASGGYLLTATQGLAANLHRELTPASNTYTSGWHLLADFSPANGYHSIIPTWWELPGKQNDVVCEVSTVTVFPAEAPHNVMYHAGDPRNLLTVVADTMSTLGNVQAYVMGDTFVVLGPEHARIVAGAGWSKRDVRMFLFENARTSVGRLRQGGPPQGDERRAMLWPRFIDPDDDSQMVPVVRRPEDIYILVAGGPGGPHSAYLPGWGSRRATRVIEAP